MGSINFSELFTIALVVLIVFGPKRLPELARRAGQMAAKVRSAVSDLRTQITAEYGDAIQPIEELRQEVQGIGKEVRGSIRDIGRSVDGITTVREYASTDADDDTEAGSVDDLEAGSDDDTEAGSVGDLEADPPDDLAVDPETARETAPERIDPESLTDGDRDGEVPA